MSKISNVLLGCSVGFFLTTLVEVYYDFPRVKQEAYKQGFEAGAKDYHERCASIGGLMVDSHHVGVHCRGIGKIEEKEIDHTYKTRSL